MKILYIINTLDPRYGGPVEGVRQMIGEVQNLGHHVELLSLDKKNDNWETKFTCKVNWLGSSLSSYCLNPRIIFWLVKNNKKYDKFIVNGIWQFQGLATLVAAKIIKLEYYVYIHGMLDPWFKINQPIKHLKKLIYWTLFERYVLKNAKSVFFITEEESQLAKSNFFDHSYKSKVIGFGISGVKGDTKLLKLNFLQRYPELNGKNFILYLGRLHKKKGCDILIEAFAQIILKTPELKLVILGPNNDGFEKTLKLKADKLGVSKMITWGGMVTEELKWGAYLSAEAFILPSHSENFGAVVPEALSCGLPVLITNKVNIWREVVEKRAGLVGEDTVDGVRMLINKWLSLEKKESIVVRRNSVVCFNEYFGVNSAAVKLIKVLENN